MLVEQLAALASETGQVSSSTEVWSYFEQQFREIWADHADQCSTQYAGLLLSLSMFALCVLKVV